MRTVNKNKQRMHYALYRESETIYKLDDDGNRIVIYEDMSTDPPTVYYEEVGQSKDGYTEPKKFLGNIALSGGDVATVEYGISTESYEAVLITEHNAIPITETSLIWFQSEPLVDDKGYALPECADYRVIKVNRSLNSDKFILSKVVK